MNIDTSTQAIVGMLLAGVGQTALVTVLAYALATLLAMPIVYCRLSRLAVLRAVGTAYVELFRGLPSLVLVLFIYFGLSNMLRFEPVPAAVIGLALTNAAYLAEYFRAGIESVPVGQWEAASALALTQRQLFWRIILPQGVSVSIPPATSQAIGLLKESAVISAIGVADITFQTLSAAHRGSPPIELFLIAGALYLLLSIPIAAISRFAETRVRNGRAAA